MTKALLSERLRTPTLAKRSEFWAFLFQSNKVLFLEIKILVRVAGALESR